MPNPQQWASMRARRTLIQGLRSALDLLGYEEVETPSLVPAPGMEPHIAPFETPFVQEADAGRARTLYLHTSPEYAMKRLLADGAGPIFQICKVFRNGEISPLHNPEFTMLELYRPQADYRRIMNDLEMILASAEGALAPGVCFSRLPYTRITVREAFVRHARIDLAHCPDAASLRAAAERIGVRVGHSPRYEDIFFHVFLERVEKHLGQERPEFLIDYPAQMASLARLKPGDPAVAERVELYANATELANGFSELTDAAEQRRRLEDEQEQRRSAGRAAYPLDEKFLSAVSRMPEAAGMAVGLDRVLMLVLGLERIEDVLLFPAHDFQ